MVGNPVLGFDGDAYDFAYVVLARDAIECDGCRSGYDDPGFIAFEVFLVAETVTRHDGHALYLAVALV